MPVFRPTKVKTRFLKICSFSRILHLWRYGSGAELIGADNDEGVLRMDASKDISILNISTLARVWVG